MKGKPVRITRRAFSAGATSIAPLLVSRHIFGDQNNAAANEKISLAAIGVGKMMYDFHLPHFVKMPDVKVVAVCDVDTTRRNAGKKRVDDAYGNHHCASYVDYRDLLQRNDLDAVVCATPDHWHANIILDTCQAGKDMYCEKPLTNNLAEAKMVMDAVHASEIIFQTGSQQRANTNFRHACELVRNGYIGKVIRVEVGVGGPPRTCDLPGEDAEPGLDWDRWLGPAPMRPYNSELSPRGMHKHFPNWRSFKEYAGGGMTDWGAHHFDIAQWGLGMDKSGPVEIVPPHNAKSKTGVKFIYDNGAELIHGGREGITFYGSDGEIFVNRGRLESKPESITQSTIGEDEIHLYRSPGNSHAGHRQDWVNCMKQRRQPNCPIEIGARTVAVCHLGNLAYLHAEELAGKTLKWDPQTWKFIGDYSAANRWQNYPYQRREGYQLPSI